VNTSIPETVERALDELAETLEQLTYARNAIGDATHHALATEQLLLELRAATDSVERTYDPETEEVSYVLPTGEAYRSQRRRRIRVAAGVAVIILLAVVLAVV
jgi:hypothetical protein